MLQIDLWKRVLIILTCVTGLWLALPNAFYTPVERHNDAIKAIAPSTIRRVTTAASSFASYSVRQR